MGFQDVMKRAPGLFVIWIFSIILVVLIAIFYIIQNSLLPKANIPHYLDSIRNLGNTIAGVGIVLCVTTVVWIILFVGLMRDVRNIWADPSSIYVSRSNIVANFAPVRGTDPGQPITGNAFPNDGTSTCFSQFLVPDSPEAYDSYRQMITLYQSSANGGKPVTQWYENPTSTGASFSSGVSVTSHGDTFENQQRLSLAYYRFLYCTKQYYQDIVNKNGIDQMTFLIPPTRANLKAGTSSCFADGAQHNIPDTQACTSGKPGTASCVANPCFTALNQTIAAQCLFYDDHVYGILNHTSPQGALSSMQVLDAATMGYQVRAAPGNPIPIPP